MRAGSSETCEKRTLRLPGDYHPPQLLSAVLTCINADLAIQSECVM